MRIIIKATNIELNKTLEQWVELRLRPLEKYGDGLEKQEVFPSGKQDEEVDVFVEIGRTTQSQGKGNIFRAEAQMRFLGKSIRAEAVADDLKEAINEVKEKIERQIVESKGKIRPQD